MAQIPVTVFSSGVLGILCVILSFMVSLARQKSKTSIGDGAGKPGADRLVIAIRVQGNFVEYVPIGLILLGAVEVSGGSKFSCELFAAFLILSRLMHAAGMYRPPPNVLRAGGAILTWVVIVGLSIEALILAG